MEKGIRKPMMRPLSDEDRKLVTLEVDGPMHLMTLIALVDTTPPAGTLTVSWALRKSPTTGIAPPERVASGETVTA
jgi:hypothetical protein